MVELFYKKLQLYILPKGVNHLFLRKPSAVYVSRKATVGEYHRKIVEILHAAQNKDNNIRPIDEFLAMSRIWRLDTGENVIEIEKYYQYERNFPI